MPIVFVGSNQTAGVAESDAAAVLHGYRSIVEEEAKEGGSAVKTGKDIAVALTEFYKSLPPQYEPPA
jgi:hypothetical protein